ncbi:RNA-directed DNA polymerase, eukaryota, reverse transcriptase zinc-binding domain protein, partial [Tanacetum coccineum]
ILENSLEVLNVLQSNLESMELQENSSIDEVGSLSIKKIHIQNVSEAVKYPTEEFQFFKGLKQGDPLSPFLFILIMESFHLSFQRVVDAGMFKGIKLSQSLSLSHMFYADDAVFVGQWSDGNINTLIHVLECFYSASGLRINMSKSKIMGVNVEDEKVKHAASKLGCLTLKSPFLYLGTKVGATMSRVSDWKEVVEKSKNLLMGKCYKGYSGEDGNVDKAHYIGGRTCWTSIVHGVKVLCSQGVNILDCMRLKLGDGENTDF